MLKEACGWAISSLLHKVVVAPHPTPSPRGFPPDAWRNINIHHFIYGLWSVHCYSLTSSLLLGRCIVYSSARLFLIFPVVYKIDFVDQRQPLQHHLKSGKKRSIMGKTSDYPVRNLISFDALEKPSWHATSTRTNARQGKTVTEMIAHIAEYHKRWEQAIAENAYNDELVKKVGSSLTLESCLMFFEKA